MLFNSLQETNSEANLMTVIGIQQLNLSLIIADILGLINLYQMAVSLLKFISCMINFTVSFGP
jgi:hypothetical protein